MPKVYAIDGITPVVHPSAFVHPSAVLIGDVIVGARAYVGPCACLRGDFGRIVVEEGANIQDTCMLHGFPGKDTVVGAGATIGHGAVLHGCVVGRGALIGMNCVVNDTLRSARTRLLRRSRSSCTSSLRRVAAPPCRRSRRSPPSSPTASASTSPAPSHSRS
jgi:NDP-sugar pyrophosphorylase family protein